MTVRSAVRRIVALQLATAGVGVYEEDIDGTESWPIHWRRMPGTPDEALVVACYGLGGDYELGVQVRIRGSHDSSTTAEDKGDEVRLALHGLENVTLDGTTLKLLHHTSTADLGVDTNGRDQVAVNFRAVTNDPNSALEH